MTDVNQKSTRNKQTSTRKEFSEMTETRNKSIINLLSSTVLALALAFSFALPAFAASGPNGTVEGDKDHPAEAAITKILEVPVGTDSPAAIFKFLVTPVAVEGSSDQADLDSMPVIGTNGTVEIDLSSGATEVVDGGVKQIIKETTNLFDKIIWTHTGVYTYHISEVKDTYTCSTSVPIEQMTYSDGEYDISVYVDRADDGSLYIRYIGALVVTPGAPGQNGNDKVDPTPGGDPSVTGDYSQMIFTNSYLKINTPDTPDPITDGVLIISKNITGGTLADPEQYFDFDVTISNPATVIDPTRTYKAYVIDGNGIVSPIPGNQAPASAIKNDGKNDYIEFTTATLTQIQLKGGESLSFVDLPVGSLFDVQEIDPKNYTASYVVTVNGVMEESMSASSAGSSLGMSQAFYTGEKYNCAAFTNTYRDITPMGIAVDNIPYIVILCLALALVTVIGVFSVKTSKKS